MNDTLEQRIVDLEVQHAELKEQIAALTEQLDVVERTARGANMVAHVACQPDKPMKLVG